MMRRVLGAVTVLGVLLGLRAATLEGQTATKPKDGPTLQATLTFIGDFLAKGHLLTRDYGLTLDEKDEYGCLGCRVLHLAWEACRLTWLEEQPLKGNKLASLRVVLDLKNTDPASLKVDSTMARINLAADPARPKILVDRSYHRYNPKTGATDSVAFKQRTDSLSHFDWYVYFDGGRFDLESALRLSNAIRYALPLCGARMSTPF